MASTDGSETRKFVIRSLLEDFVPPTPSKPPWTGSLLLELPLELRLLVYRAALVTPPTYRKRHLAACKYAKFDTVTPESPPVFTYRNQRQRYTPGLGCKCSRRSGLNVLLASRQVNNEAGSVF
jgi:hypothetical protein